MRNLNFIFALLFSMPWLAMGQIVYTQGDLHQADDTLRVSRAVNLSGHDFAATGPNYSWDFSDLTAVSQQQKKYVDIASVPILYQLVFNSWVANLAQQQEDVDFLPDFELTDLYEFYKKTSSSYNSVGYAATVAGIPFPMKWDQPDVLYQLPVNYGATYQSQSGFNFKLEGMAYIEISRDRQNEVDGWGSLTTPFGTFETIRIHSLVNEFDSLYVDSIGTGVPIIRQYDEYKWLANGYGTPILQASVELGISSIEYIDSVRSITFGIPQIPHALSEMKLYPNPVTTNGVLEYHLTTAAEVKLQVFDLTGRERMELNLGLKSAGMHRQTLQIAPARLEAGSYLLQLTDGRKRMSTKLQVQ